MRKYTHKILWNGKLCSEHTSLQHAEKMLRRMVAMSNGRLTAAAFEVVEL